MNMKVHDEKYKGYNIEIVTDEFIEDPRECDGNLGVMYCKHSRYSLGDKVEKSKVSRDLTNAVIKKTLYLLDHSGLTISTEAFRDPWDSGTVGVIYTTPIRIMDYFGVNIVNDELIKKAEKILEAEVETYDLYLRGCAYGYIVSKNSIIDSCFGFLQESYEDLITIAKEIVDTHAEAHLSEIELLLKQYAGDLFIFFKTGDPTKCCDSYKKIKNFCLGE